MNIHIHVQVYSKTQSRMRGVVEFEQDQNLAKKIALLDNSREYQLLYM